MWGNRVVIPRAGQNLVLQELHEAHPGATRMKQLARTLVWWPSIDQDIENTVKSCAECQTNQSSPTETPLLPWQWPSRPWSRVHVDFPEMSGHGVMFPYTSSIFSVYVFVENVLTPLSDSFSRLLQR